MTLGGVQVSEHELPSSFAKFFANKVNVITNGVAVDPAVYNGKKKLDAGNHMFMTTNDVKKCLESIKLKNTEGYDRIPQRVLVDGMEHLLCPFAKLFEHI